MSVSGRGTVPLRVLIKGASTVNWTSPMGGPRTDFLFSRVLEQELLARGHSVETRTRSIASEPTSRLLTTWEREVLAYSPDVIVLVYGHYESIHLFLPRWFERHANSLRSRRGPLARLYRDRLLRPVWMVAARLQARLDRIVDPTIRRRSDRVVKDLDLYLDHVRGVASPLVYLFELLPPAPRRESWFPGMARRIEVMNGAISGLVNRRSEDEVRYLRVAPLVQEIAGGDLDVATADGFHYSPALHRRIGEELARDIADWAGGQPHLTSASEESRRT